MSKINTPFKANLWWNSHLSLALVFAFYQLIGLQHPVAIHATLGGFALFVLSACGTAAFVHLLNDYCDIKKDSRSGARSLAIGVRKRWISLEICLGLGCAFLPWLRLPTDAVILTLLVCEFVLIVLYNVPPVRLKNRGLAGTVAATLYAYVIPCLVSLAVFGKLSGDPSNLWIMGLITLWASVYGFRSMLTHQLEDVSRDQLANINTFVMQFGWKQSYDLLGRIIFPVEAGLFLLMLSVLSFRSPLCLPGFIIYLYRILLWQSRNNLAGSRNPRRLSAINRIVFLNVKVMSEFVSHWLPVLVLSPLLLRQWAVIIPCILYFMLFDNGVKAYLVNAGSNSKSNWQGIWQASAEI